MDREKYDHLMMVADNIEQAVQSIRKMESMDLNLDHSPELADINFNGVQLNSVPVDVADEIRTILIKNQADNISMWADEITLIK